MNIKIGICGCGFVGGTMAKGLSALLEIGVETYDKFDKTKSTQKSLRDLVHVSDVIFVCVPTPMKMSDGSCDTSIVESIVAEISEIVASENSKLITKEDLHKIVVIRSTVPPGTTEILQKKYSNIEIMFNPEFLRETHALSDFMHQTRIVLGGDLGKELLMKGKGPMTKVSLMYRKAFPGVPILTTNRTTAEMVKYVTNVFLATKVSLANEFYDICNSFNIDYDTMIRIAQHDERLGKSHWQVPGTDGLGRGYGGHCLSKDIQALMFSSRSKNIEPIVMQAVWDKNNEVRENRDWEDMEGRAVTKDVA